MANKTMLVSQESHKMVQQNNFLMVSIKIKVKCFNISFLSWELVKHGVPQGSALGPLLFLIYINDLPVALNKMATSVIFADDTSVIITNNNKTDFENALQQTRIEMSSWFRSNLLTLNYEKTYLYNF